MHLTQRDVVDRLHDASGLSRMACEVAVRELPNVIMQAVANGDSITIPGFIRVERIVHSQTEGRNIRTGQSVTIPAHYRVKMKPSAVFRKLVKQVSP